MQLHSFASTFICMYLNKTRRLVSSEYSQSSMNVLCVEPYLLTHSTNHPSTPSLTLTHQNHTPTHSSSPTQSLIHSHTLSLTHSLTHQNHPLILSHSHPHSHTHSHSYTPSLSLTHPPTHPLPHSLTHSFTHSLTYKGRYYINIYNDNI